MSSRRVRSQFTAVVMSESVNVEVVYAEQRRQLLISMSTRNGATIAEVLEQSRIYDEFPDIDLRSFPVGIWGKCVERSETVRDGDRVELYRPLVTDPRDARRRLAEIGQTMGQPQIKA